MSRPVQWDAELHSEDVLWVCPHCDAHLHSDCVGRACPSCEVELDDE